MTYEFIKNRAIVMIKTSDHSQPLTTNSLLHNATQWINHTILLYHLDAATKLDTRCNNFTDWWTMMHLHNPQQIAKYGTKYAMSWILSAYHIHLLYKLSFRAEDKTWFCFQLRKIFYNIHISEIWRWVMFCRHFRRKDRPHRKAVWVPI